MKALSLPLFAFVAATLAGCEGSGESDAELSEDALANGATSVAAYRFDPSGGGEGPGRFLARLKRTGSAVEGHTMMIAGDDAPTSRMALRGTVDGDGTYRLKWAFTLKGTQEIPLVLAARGGALVGKIGEAGDQSEVTLVPIKAGDGPIAGAFENRNDSGCRTAVVGMELFGLAKPDVEEAINRKLQKAADRVQELCTGGVEYAQGGAYLGLLDKDVVTFSTRHETVEGEVYKNEPRGRENLFVATGKAIALWGDILVRGKDAELTAVIEKSIDSQPESIVAAANKVELKQIMASERAAGRFERDYFLGKRGVSFAAPGFSDPRVTALTVTWDALRPLLAPNGKARSAWTP